MLFNRKRMHHSRKKMSKDIVSFSAAAALDTTVLSFFVRPSVGRTETGRQTDMHAHVLNCSYLEDRQTGDGHSAEEKHATSNTNL